MATQLKDSNSIREPCPSCGAKAPHEVHVEIRIESGTGENAEFSREPYRVAVCAECGAETAMRMTKA